MACAARAAALACCCVLSATPPAQYGRFACCPCEGIRAMAAPRPLAVTLAGGPAGRTAHTYADASHEDEHVGPATDAGTDGRPVGAGGDAAVSHPDRRRRGADGPDARTRASPLRLRAPPLHY